MTSKFSSSSEKARGLRAGFSAFLERIRTKRPRLSRLPKKFLWIGLAAVVVVGAGIMAYVKLHPAQASTSSGTTLQTATARQGDLTLLASGVGTLVSVSEASLGFSSAGELTGLYVKVGDQVDKDQLLAELDDSSLQIKLAQARQTLLELTSPATIATAQQNVVAAELVLYYAQVALNTLNSGTNEALLENAQATLTLALRNEEKVQEAYDKIAGMSHDESEWADTYKRLYAAQQATKTARYYVNLYSAKPSQRQIDAAKADLALAEATLEEDKTYLAALTGGDVPEDATGTALLQLNQAKLDVQTAQDNLDATKLYAPFSGTVMTLNAQVGGTVSGTIMTLADLSQANIQFYMDETDWSNVKVGYDVEVTFDALPDQVFTGKVTQVMPGLISIQGSSMVEGLAQLDASVDQMGLPVGVSGAIDVISAQAKNAILVPVEALHELTAGQYAVFVMKDGTPTLTMVEVGIQDETFAEIKSGLNVGDVVTTGIVETQK